MKHINHSTSCDIILHSDPSNFTPPFSLDALTKCCIDKYLPEDFRQPKWMLIYMFIFDVILVGFILVAGMIGNVLSFLVLNKENRGNSTPLILRTLALWDSVFLGCCFFFQFMNTLSVVQHWFSYFNFNAYFTVFVYTIGMVSRTCRNWTVVVVTLERWIAVCHPLKAPRMCTRKKARLALMWIFIISSLCFSPWFGALTITEPLERCQSTSMIGSGLLVKVGVKRNFRQSYVFMFYYRVIFYTFTVIFAPLVILCVLNTMLVVATRRAKRQRQGFTSGSFMLSPNRSSNGACCPSRFQGRASTGSSHQEDSTVNDPLVIKKSSHGVRPFSSALVVPKGGTPMTCHRHTQQQQRGAEITRLCMGIVVVYICTEIPALLYQVIVFLQWDEVRKILKPLSNCFVCFNSGINFVIYVFLGKRFRRNLKRLCDFRCCGEYGGRSSRSADSYANTSTAGSGVPTALPRLNLK